MEEYENKLSDLQKYVPFLEQMILKLKKDGKPREAELERIQMLYNILTNKKKKCKIETLNKCESVLVKLHSNWEKRNTDHEKSGNDSKANSKSSDYRELSAPESPQENFDKTYENHKPIVIPTERKESSKYDFHDRSRNDLRDYEYKKTDSSSDNKELYRRRSPSRYSSHQSSRYNSMYDQYSDVDDIHRTKWESSSESDRHRSVDDGYHHNEKIREKSRGNNNTSSQSIFNRLGEKFDVTSKDLYENFKIKVPNDRNRIAVPPQPIADVLKSPPLSLNDINDLMNEGGVSSERYSKNEKHRSESISKDSRRNLEVARKKLIKIDVSSDSPKRKDSPTPSSSLSRSKNQDSIESESFHKLKENFDHLRYETKSIKYKHEMTTEKDVSLKNKSESQTRFSNEANKSSETQSDANNIRLAYKYNPHPRKSIESLQKTDNSSDNKLLDRQLSKPTDPRINLPLHNTLPSLNPSDPRLKSRSFDSPLNTSQKHIQSFLDMTVHNPFTTTNSSFTNSSISLPSKDVERNFFMKSIPQMPIPTPVINSIPLSVPPPIVKTAPLPVPPPIIPKANSINLQSFSKPTTSLLLHSMEPPPITYGKFRAVLNDQVERNKYMESKRNKAEPQTYREYRKAKLKAEKQKEFVVSQNESSGLDKNSTEIGNINSTTAGKKNVLDSMYRNSDWRGELSHVSTSFKIPKLSEKQKESVKQKESEKSKSEDKSSSEKIALNDKDKHKKEENKKLEKKIVVDDEDNWDDIDFEETKSKNKKKNKEKRKDEEKKHKLHSKEHKEHKEKKVEEEEKVKSENVSLSSKAKDEEDEKLSATESIEKVAKQLKEKSTCEDKKENQDIIELNKDSEVVAKVDFEEKAERTDEHKELLNKEKEKDVENHDTEIGEIFKKEQEEEHKEDPDVENTRKQDESEKAARLSRIRQRRQSVATYVYIEVPDDEIDDDKSAISMKNIIAGKRERKSRISTPTDRKQTPSPAKSKSPSSVKSLSLTTSSPESNASLPKTNKTQPKTNTNNTTPKSKKQSKKHNNSTTIAATADNSPTPEITETDQICVVSSTTTNTTTLEESSSSKCNSDNVEQKTSLVDLLNPSLLNEKSVLGLLEKVLAREKFLPIKEIIEKNENNKQSNDVKLEKDKNDNDNKDNGDENEIEKNIEKDAVAEEENIKSQQQQQIKPKPHKTELDRLNEDIRDMFISKEVITATGRRVSAINAEKKQLEAIRKIIVSPKRKIGPKSKMKKLNRLQNQKKTTINVNKSVKVNQKYKNLKIKQPKISINKAVFKKWKEKFEMMRTQNITSKETEKQQIVDNDNDGTDDKSMPVLEPNTPHKQSSKLSGKFNDKPCPKSKKLFYKESDDENNEDNDFEIYLPETLSPITKNVNFEKYNEQETLLPEKKETVIKKSSKKKGKRSKSTLKVTSSVVTSLIKNTNANMHIQSVFTQKCVICEANSGKTNHYVTIHPDLEVYISRLPPDTMISLKQNQININSICCRKNKVITYQHQCPFCDNIQSLTKKMWFNHIGIHTGEYGYQCSDCKRKFSVLPAIQSHKKNHCKQATTISLRNLNLENSKNIITHICDLCNYIQINKDNILKHLQTQHEILDMNLIERNMSQLILIEFLNNSDNSDIKKRKKKLIPSKNDNKNSENLIGKNIEAFLPKENVDLNLDKNLLEYMNEISFKTYDSSSFPPHKSSQSTSIIDQLSMKFNNSIQNRTTTITTETTASNSLVDDIFQHSIFSDMSMVNQLSEKLGESVKNNQQNEQFEQVTNFEKCELLENQQQQQQQSNEISNFEQEKDPLEINSNVITNKTIQIDCNDNNAGDNDTQSLESWEKRFSQQISDGGLSLADKFNQSITNGNSNLNNCKSLNLFDQISQRIRRSNESSPEKKNDDDTSSDKIVSLEKISNVLCSRRISIAERLSERLKNGNKDTTCNSESILDNNSSNMEKNMKEKISLESKTTPENESNSTVIDKEKSSLDQELSETEDLDTSFEDRLVIDESDDSNSVSISKEDNQKESTIEETNKEKTEDPLSQNQVDSDDDDADDDEVDDDDDDGNWEDIEEIITSEKSTSVKSKNKTMFETLSRLYTSIVPSVSTKSQSNLKKDQKSTETKKSAKQFLSKPPLQSKPNIFVIDKTIIQKQKENSRIIASETEIPSTSSDLTFLSSMEIDPTLPDILLSDEADPDESNNLSKTVADLISHSPLPDSDRSDQSIDLINSDSTKKLKVSDNIQDNNNEKNDIIDITNDDLSSKLPIKIQKIFNIGFRKISNDQILYYCLIENCSFLYSNLPAGIEVHFKTEHPNIKWDGYCYNCEASVSEDSNMLISREINHMLEVHLKISQSIRSLSPADENSNSSKSSDSRGLIKIRRFSGDKLSSKSKDDIQQQISFDQQQNNNKPIIHNQLYKQPESQNISHFRLKQITKKEFTITPSELASSSQIKLLSGGKNLISPTIKQTTHISSDDKNDSVSISKTIDNNLCENEKKSPKINETPFLKISEVISLRSEESSTQNNSIKSTTTTATICNKILLDSLKPWLNKSISMKSNLIIDTLLEEKSLYCLYKCMGIDCDFRAQTTAKMKLHLMAHEKSDKTNAYLECPYCNVISCDHNDYLIHMNYHSKDIYQCPKCFYRSCTNLNVIIHIYKYHPNNELKLLLCIGKPRHFDEVKQMAIKKTQSVKSIPCIDCPKTFYIVEEFLDHVKKHDENKTHYMCGFCHAFIEIIKAEEHLLNIHSISTNECLYCYYAAPNNTDMKNHLSQEHPSCLMLACVRTSRASKNVVLANFGHVTNENILCPCRFTEAELDDIGTNLTIKQTNTYPVATYVKKLKPTTTTTKPTTICIDDNNQKPLNIEITSVQSLAPQAKNIIFSKTNSSSIISNESNIIENNINDNNKNSSTSLIEKSLPEINTQNLNTENSNEIFENVSDNLLEQNKTEMETVSSTFYLNTEITGKTLMERIEKAAKEIVKDTGFEGDELYKCSFIGCNTSVIDSIKFSDHIFQHSSANTDFKCYHCKKILKSVVELKSHIRIHGIHRYFCYFCNYTSSVTYDLIKHMNSSHSKMNFLTYPLISGRNDKTKDFFVICPRNTQPFEIIQYGERMIRTVERKKSLEKRYFTPEEIDKLPRQPIFFEELYCTICNYKTKVRINMIRHLDDHKNALNVTNVDPVNPVPCLNTNEKHFDKMVNLALSSNIYNKDGKISTTTIITSDDIKLPEFVPECKRYVCGVPECTYLTINESMLKCHLNALHATEKTYTCPHCSYEICKRGILVDKIIQHLKYHDIKLFVCNKCQYMHYQKNVVERHISDKHPMEDVQCVYYERTATNITRSLLTIPGRAYPSASTSNSSSIQDLKQTNSDLKWECSICKGRTVTYNQMTSHANKKHGIKYRIMCTRCNFGSNAMKQIVDHVSSRHPASVGEAKVMFYKINSIEQAKQNDTTPLWKRDPTKVKNIRGILMEEDNDIEQQQNKNDFNYEAIPCDDFESDIIKKVNKKNTNTKTTTQRKSNPPQAKPITLARRKSIATPYVSHSKTSTPTTLTTVSPSLTTSSSFTSFKQPTLPLSVSTSQSSSKMLSETNITPMAPPPATVTKPTLSSSSTNKEESIVKIFKEPLYNCERCSFIGETEFDLENHIKTFDHLSHLMKMDKTLIFICFQCSYSSKSIENLHEHWKAKHWSTKIVEGDSISTPDHPFWFKVSSQIGCARCNYQGSYSETIKHHSIHHSEMTQAFIDIKKRNECSHCSFEYENLNSLSSHFKDSHKMFDNPIKNINTEFLNNILKYGHTQRYIRCLLCCTTFADSFNYIHHHSQQHKKISRKYETIKNTILYHCPNCNYTTLNENEQYLHITTHNQFHLYNCPLCTEKCASLEIHFKTHHSDKGSYMNYMTTYHNSNSKLFTKMKIIFPNGYLIEKHQAQLTEFGSMEITKQADTLLTKITKNECINIKRKSKPNNIFGPLLSNSPHNQIISNKIKPSTSSISAVESISQHDNSVEDVFKSKIETKIIKKLIKRRKSVAAVCYTDRFDDDDDNNDCDDKNDVNWKPSIGNSKRNIKCVNTGIKKRIIEIDTESIKDNKNVESDDVEFVSVNVIDPFIIPNRKRKISNDKKDDKFPLSCDKVIRIDD